MRSLSVHSNHYNKILLFFKFSIRMSGKNVHFGDKKNQKSDFYKNKKVIKIHDIDANKIVVSKEESYSTKNSFNYFIR